MLKKITIFFVTMIFLIGLDLMFIGVFYRLLKIWHPIKNINLKDKLLSEKMYFGTFTDINRSTSDSFINYGNRNITLILTPELIIVRNTLLTYIMSLNLQSITNFSVKKKFIGHRITLSLSFDGQKNIFYFRTQKVKEWGKSLSDLGIKQQ